MGRRFESCRAHQLCPKVLRLTPEDFASGRPLRHPVTRKPRVPGARAALTPAKRLKFESCRPHQIHCARFSGKAAEAARSQSTIAAATAELFAGFTSNTAAAGLESSGARGKEWLGAHRKINVVSCYICSAPATIVFVSVSITMSSLPPFTTTTLTFIGDIPCGVICAVSVQSELI
jgi:hypothetical protein